MALLTRGVSELAPEIPNQTCAFGWSKNGKNCITSARADKAKLTPGKNGRDQKFI